MKKTSNVVCFTNVVISQHYEVKVVKNGENRLKKRISTFDSVRLNKSSEFQFV